jgi:hypothetical protein
MFATLHSDINSIKSCLFHPTGQPNSQKGRGAKVKDGIISETKFLGTISVDRYSCHWKLLSELIKPILIFGCRARRQPLGHNT